MEGKDDFWVIEYWKVLKDAYKAGRIVANTYGHAALGELNNDHDAALRKLINGLPEDYRKKLGIFERFTVRWGISDGLVKILLRGNEPQTKKA